MVGSAMRTFLILGLVPYMLTTLVSAEQTCSADDAQCAETKANSLLQSHTARSGWGGNAAINPTVEPACDEVGTGDSKEYRGCQTATLSGRTCQRWDAQSPHSHSRTEANYPDSGLEENYCRNPDGEYSIWCYTTDSDSRWEFCTPLLSPASSAVSPSAPPACDEAKTGNGKEYRGCQTATVTGKTCQQWDAQSPHSHSRTEANYPDSGLDGNFCRNPDGEYSIWCYTTEADSRWEFCAPLMTGTFEENTDTNTCGHDAVKECGELHCSRGCAGNFQACVADLGCQAEEQDIIQCGDDHCSRGCAGNFADCVQNLGLSS